jgi:HAD superfamily hydrolase (TIGR01509 family)
MYKKILDGKTCVIFDLDGTIADTSSLWNQAFDAVLKPMGISWMDHSQFPSGITIRMKWDLIVEKYRDYINSKVNVSELVQQTADAYLNVLPTQPLEVTEGFWDLAYKLRVEKKLKMGLATNTAKREAQATLQKIEAVSTFDFIVAGDSIKKPKPDPEIYISAVKEAGAIPSQILVFEDSVVGARSSVSAGMETIVIWNGEYPKLQYPLNILMFLPSFAGLDQVLDTTTEEEIRSASEELEN